jgi:hypothetical protein
MDVSYMLEEEWPGYMHTYWVDRHRAMIFDDLTRKFTRGGAWYGARNTDKIRPRLGFCACSLGRSDAPCRVYMTHNSSIVCAERGDILVKQHKFMWRVKALMCIDSPWKSVLLSKYLEKSSISKVLTVFKQKNTKILPPSDQFQINWLNFV